jgi:carbonic anhydrase/acetyltransferase-like protein (isoleucine patch superfamily)
VTPRYEHEGRAPSIDPTAWVAETAVLVGDVRIEAHARVLHGAVLTDDGGPVSIGEYTIVMEQAVLRGTAAHPMTVADHCVIGVGASLVGAAVGSRVFVASGARVFNGALLGVGSEVRINAVVHLRTVLPDGATVPIGWVAVGDPASILPPDAHDEIWAIQRELDFPRTVFGVDREGADPMGELTERWSRALDRHRDDRAL